MTNKKIGFISSINDKPIRGDIYDKNFLNLAPMKLAGKLIDNGVDKKNIKILVTDYGKKTNDIVQELNEQIKEFGFDFLGFSSYMWNGIQTEEIVKSLIDINSNVKILVGGPDVINLDLDNSNIIKVIGKGEKAILDIITNEENIKLMNGFYVNTNGALNEKKQYNLDGKGFYYSKELLEQTIGLEKINKDMGWYETSTGCPYSCGFCAHDLEKTGVTVEESDKIRQELVNIKKFGIKRLFVVDAIFGGKKNKSKEVLKIFNEIIPDIELLIYSRPEFLDEEIIKLLSQVNIHEVRLGLQSLNPDIPKWLRSNNLKLVNKYLPKLSENNIPWRAELIIGLIGDTFNGLRNSYRDVINNFNPTFLYGYHLTVLDNTEIIKYKDKIDEKVWVKSDEKGRAVSSNSYTEKELQEMLIYSTAISSLYMCLKKYNFENNFSFEELEEKINSFPIYKNEEMKNIFVNTNYPKAELFWKKVLKI